MTNLTQVPMYTSFNDLVILSVNHTGEPMELDCSLTLCVGNLELQAYTVSVSTRDLLFYTSNGTVTYLVDMYAERPRVVLHDYDLDIQSA